MSDDDEPTTRTHRHMFSLNVPEPRPMPDGWPVAQHVERALVAVERLTCRDPHRALSTARDHLASALPRCELLTAQQPATIRRLPASPDYRTAVAFLADAVGSLLAYGRGRGPTTTHRLVLDHELVQVIASDDADGVRFQLYEGALRIVAALPALRRWTAIGLSEWERVVCDLAYVAELLAELLAHSPPSPAPQRVPPS